MTLAVISRPRMISGRYPAAIVAGCASIFLFCSTAIRESSAESVEYAGRNFKVDTLKEVDAQNVTLEVDGHPLLASRAVVGRAVFKIYAQKPELLLREGSFQGYGTWLAILPSKGDDEGAVLAVERVVITPEIDLPQKVGFYGELVTNEEGEKALFRAVSSMEGEERGVCGALAFLSGASQLALKNGRQAWLAKTCPQALVEMAQLLMMKGDRRSGTAMLRAATVFSDDDNVGYAAKVSLERMEALDVALRSQDPVQLDSALRVASFDTLLNKYFHNTRSVMITEFSSQALNDRKPARALRGLSLLDFSIRNDAHHELLSKALDQVTFEERDVVLDHGVRGLIRSYSTKDEVVRRQAVTTLERWIEQAVGESNPGDALRLFEVLKELRLDPSVDNDLARGVIAESFVDNGDERSADEVLSGLRSELPWIYRFRLLLKRDIYMLIMVSLGWVVIARWAIMLYGISRKRTAARRIAQEAERRAAEAAERGRYHSQFADGALRADGFMDIDEYAAALKKFKLHSTASLADIKNAFRNVVKTLHPDINPQVTKQDTDTFIDLTKTYERLLVLHAEREQRAKSSK